MGDKVRTLSDAILLGSTFRKQSFQDIYNRGRTCAIGSAAEAIGIMLTNFQVEPDNYHIECELTARFPAIEQDVDCPVMRCEHSNSVHDMVVHLNDGHRWKRERIAEWLKTKGL